jgi:hemerythrin
MRVEWDGSLALGHGEIDGQHREIFRRFGALVLAMEQGTQGEVGVLFEHLGEYVAQHFAAEERAMAASAYPGATVHAAAHARFAREYRELRALYEAAGARAAILVKTRTWIEGWLRGHIGRVDRALAAHLRER